MNEQEVREFEENIVKGANIAFQRLVNQKKKEDGELVFSRNGHIFRVKAVDLDKKRRRIFQGYVSSFWLYRKRNLGSWAKYVNILRHFS